MPEKNHQNWLKLLKYPEISPQISSEDVYRAACIGAVMLLFEAGDCDGLMEAVQNASAPESRARALAALENLAASGSPLSAKAVSLALSLLEQRPDAAV